MSSSELSVSYVNDSYMGDSRIQELLSQSHQLPPRMLEYGDKDCFDLLSVQDTFEPIVGVLFSGCEAIEEHFVGKRDRRKDEVTLPEVSFDEARRFVIERQVQSDKSKQFFFQRIDNPSSGFIIFRNPEGHILLKNPDQGDTPINNDEEYGRLISQATNFLREYTTKLGMNPEQLAPEELPPPKVKSVKREHSPFGSIAKKVAKVVLATSIYTGLPAYCVYGAVENGSQWEANATNGDIHSVNLAKAAFSHDNIQLTNFETAIGASCTAAIAPYSPNGALGNISISDAANQLVREGNCDNPGENTQLRVVDYRADINDISNDNQNVSNAESQLVNQLHSRRTEIEAFVDFCGVVVGGIGDLAVLAIHKRKKVGEWFNHW